MTPDFSCKRCQDCLPWYVADTLANDERAAMERHLATCTRCRDALEAWREVGAALHRADDHIPLDTASVATWAHITHRLEAHTARTYKVDERTPMSLQDTNTPNTSTPASVSPAARPHTRIHSLISLIAAVALIAFSASIFSHFAARGNVHGSKVTVPPHAACAPSQATANLPAHTLLTAISPVGTDDGWAVGRVWDPQATTPPATLILRLQHCHWAPVGTPIPAAELFSVSMATPDDGWAVGVTLKRDPQSGTPGLQLNNWLADQLLVLHYTGGSWQQVQVTADTRVDSAMVKMASATEGWMLLDQGKRMTIVNSTTAVPSFLYTLLHYQNGTWTNASLSFLKPSMQINDLDVRQSGDAWIVGDDNNGGALAAHYSGGVWTPYFGAAIGADATTLLSVSVVSPSDVWASGSNIYHFDGTHWTRASIPDASGSAAGNTSPNVHSFPKIVMLSPTQGWVFPFPDAGYYHSSAGTPRQALRYHLGVWQWTTLQLLGATTNLSICCFTATSPTHGWALGMRLAPNGIFTTESTLLYYDAGSWGVVRPQP